MRPLTTPKKQASKLHLNDLNKESYINNVNNNNSNINNKHNNKDNHDHSFIPLTTKSNITEILNTYNNSFYKKPNNHENKSNTKAYLNYTKYNHCAKEKNTFPQIQFPLMVKSNINTEFYLDKFNNTMISNNNWNKNNNTDTRTKNSKRNNTSTNFYSNSNKKYTNTNRQRLIKTPCNNSNTNYAYNEDFSAMNTNNREILKTISFNDYNIKTDYANHNSKRKSYIFENYINSNLCSSKNKQISINTNKWAPRNKLNNDRVNNNQNKKINSKRSTSKDIRFDHNKINNANTINIEDNTKLSTKYSNFTNNSINNDCNTINTVNTNTTLEIVKRETSNHNNISTKEAPIKYFKVDLKKIFNDVSYNNNINSNSNHISNNINDNFNTINGNETIISNSSSHIIRYNNIIANKRNDKQRKSENSSINIISFIDSDLKNNNSSNNKIKQPLVFSKEVIDFLKQYNKHLKKFIKKSNNNVENDNKSNLNYENSNSNSINHKKQRLNITNLFQTSDIYRNINIVNQALNKHSMTNKDTITPFSINHEKQIKARNLLIKEFSILNKNLEFIAEQKIDIKKFSPYILSSNKDNNKGNGNITQLIPLINNTHYLNNSNSKEYKLYIRELKKQLNYKFNIKNLLSVSESNEKHEDENRTTSITKTKINNNNRKINDINKVIDNFISSISKIDGNDERMIKEKLDNIRKSMSVIKDEELKLSLINILNSEGGCNGINNHDINLNSNVDKVSLNDKKKLFELVMNTIKSNSNKNINTNTSSDIISLLKDKIIINNKPSDNESTLFSHNKQDYIKILNNNITFNSNTNIADTNNNQLLLLNNNEINLIVNDIINKHLIKETGFKQSQKDLIKQNFVDKIKHELEVINKTMMSIINNNEVNENIVNKRNTLSSFGFIKNHYSGILNNECNNKKIDSNTKLESKFSSSKRHSSNRLLSVTRIGGNNSTKYLEDMRSNTNSNNTNNKHISNHSKNSKYSRLVVNRDNDNRDSSSQTSRSNSSRNTKTNMNINTNTNNVNSNIIRDFKDNANLETEETNIKLQLQRRKLEKKKTVMYKSNFKSNPLDLMLMMEDTNKRKSKFDIIVNSSNKDLSKINDSRAEVRFETSIDSITKANNNSNDIVSRIQNESKSFFGNMTNSLNNYLNKLISDVKRDETQSKNKSNRTNIVHSKENEDINNKGVKEHVKNNSSVVSVNTSNSNVNTGNQIYNLSHKWNDLSDIVISHIKNKIKINPNIVSLKSSGLNGIIDKKSSVIIKNSSDLITNEANFKHRESVFSFASGNSINNDLDIKPTKSGLLKGLLFGENDKIEKVVEKQINKITKTNNTNNNTITKLDKNNNMNSNSLNTKNSQYNNNNSTKNRTKMKTNSNQDIPKSIIQSNSNINNINVKNTNNIKNKTTTVTNISKITNNTSSTDNANITNNPKPRKLVNEIISNINNNINKSNHISINNYNNYNKYLHKNSSKEIKEESFYSKQLSVNTTNKSNQSDLDNNHNLLQSNSEEKVEFNNHDNEENSNMSNNILDNSFKIRDSDNESKDENDNESIRDDHNNSIQHIRSHSRYSSVKINEDENENNNSKECYSYTNKNSISDNHYNNTSNLQNDNYKINNSNNNDIYDNEEIGINKISNQSNKVRFKDNNRLKHNTNTNKEKTKEQLNKMSSLSSLLSLSSKKSKYNNNNDLNDKRNKAVKLTKENELTYKLLDKSNRNKDYVSEAIKHSQKLLKKQSKKVLIKIDKDNSNNNNKTNNTKTLKRKKSLISSKSKLSKNTKRDNTSRTKSSNNKSKNNKNNHYNDIETDTINDNNNNNDDNNYNRKNLPKKSVKQIAEGFFAQRRSILENLNNENLSINNHENLLKRLALLNQKKEEEKNKAKQHELKLTLYKSSRKTKHSESGSMKKLSNSNFNSYVNKEEFERQLKQEKKNKDMLDKYNDYANLNSENEKYERFNFYAEEIHLNELLKQELQIQYNEKYLERMRLINDFNVEQYICDVEAKEKSELNELYKVSAYIIDIDIIMLLLIG